MMLVYADSKFLAAFIMASITGIFAADALIPLGVAGGVPYIAPVLFSYWFENRRNILAVAVVCSVLTVVGFFLSPPGNEMWMVYANRFIAFFAIWITTISIIRHKQNAEELRKAHELQAKTFASLDEAVLVVALPSRKIIFCNQAIEKIFGYSIEEVVGESTEFLHVNHKMFIRFGTELNSALNETGVLKTEFQAKKKNGEFFVSAHTITEIKDNLGQRVAVVSVMRDITERKKAEELIKNRTIELEEANKKLDEFNYIVTHDLKEPLRTLSNYTGILQKNAGDRLDQRSLQAIDFISDATKRMRQMVNGLRQFSGVGREGIKMEAVDLNDCMSQVAHNLEVVVKEADGLLRWEKLPTVSGDLTMLCMVLQNLVSNAFKFRAGRLPEVTVSSLRLNGKCEITVADNGIGIDKDYFDQIFEPFQRLHSHSEYEGSGIGLSICRKIIDYHGGEIKMESKKGIGSKFKFVLNQTQAPQTGEITDQA